MKKAYLVLVALVLLPLLLVAGLFGYVVYQFTHISIDRYDQPLTLAQARKITSYPFPPSAHAIYFAGASDWQYFIVFIRYSVAPEDVAKELSPIPTVNSDLLSREEINPQKKNQMSQSIRPSLPRSPGFTLKRSHTAA